MHEAYILYPPEKIPVQIESMTGFENKLILGTRQGHLLMYSFEPNPDTNRLNLQLLQYDKNFSKKPVTQIEAISEYKLIFSLSDGIVNVNDYSRHGFPLIHTAQKTKGATEFALDIKKSKSLTGELALVCRLCVVVKRKLQCYYWKQNGLLEFGNDIDLNDVPKTIAWNNNCICVGFKTEYVIYDISGEQSKKIDLFPTSSSKSIEPCISLIEDGVFAVAKDEYLVTVYTEKYTNEGKESGSGLVKPDASLLTTKDTRNLKSLTWSEPFQALVWDEPFIVGLITDAVEVRIFDHVDMSDKGTLIQTIPQLPKARFLTRGKQGLLYAASASHLWCIQAVEISKQREHLLQEENFHLALQLTNISDESPEFKVTKINEIQTRHAYNLFINKHFRESMKEFSKLSTDPIDVIRLFPDLLPENGKNKLSSYSKKPAPILDEKDIENGLLALIDYLTEVRYSLRQDLVNKSESKLSAGKNISALLSIIDTTLLKCYLQTNDSMVASVLRMNYCYLEESERVLKKYDKYVELIILYQTKGQHKRALQLLQAQAETPGSPLYGHDRTVQYLQHLGNENKQLIFEFAGWVLEKHPDDGLKIFIEDIPEVENMPRAEVLDFLLKDHKQLVVQYLEHIINVWDEQKALFHNILIQQYREKLLGLKNDPDIESDVQKKTARDTINKKLLAFLRKSKYYHAEKVLGEFPYTDLFEARAIILGRLGKHEKVVAIFVQILGDFDKAVDYCDQTYDENDPKSCDVYVTLIKTILTPPVAPPYSDLELHPRCLKPDIETVLTIMERNAKKINPYAVLQILPDDIPLVRIKSFLEIALNHHLERKRKTQILKGLYYAEHLQTHEQKIHYESKHLLVTELSVCPVCKKKFSYQSAFVRTAEGSIVHFSCQDKI
ncbi:vam6/Vps39-like protein [Wyeomyia smithii]|uniref:vam6/Vps39-like protein n=1 Tax=Wyeomyia smithii TaxID=174621 RepID=UPI002467D80F|nr:vam6/Vps39-like protein [Wyeomyia smithii]XP_055540398.1 vam6/Vps39-like protein [Wyeomyia smithii]